MFTIPDVYVLFSLNDVFKKGSPEYWGGRDRKWEVINGKHVDIIRTKCMQISEHCTLHFVVTLTRYTQQPLWLMSNKLKANVLSTLDNSDIEHQNEEEIWFQWLWTWHEC